MAQVVKQATESTRIAAAQWRFIQRRKAERQLAQILSTTVGRALVRAGRIMVATDKDGAPHIAWGL